MIKENLHIFYVLAIKEVSSSGLKIISELLEIDDRAELAIVRLAPDIISCGLWDT